MDSTTAALAKLTAMHGAHQQLGAEFLYRDGWKLPSHYSSSEEEVSRVTNGGGIFDISPIGKLSFQGADVLAELPRALALPESLTVGKAIRCPSPTASEDSRESVTVAALTYDEALVLTSPGSRDSIAEALEEALSGCAHMIDLTSAWAGIGIMGPRSVEALAKIVELDLGPRQVPRWRMRASQDSRGPLSPCSRRRLGALRLPAVRYPRLRTIHVGRPCSRWQGCRRVTYRNRGL